MGDRSDVFDQVVITTKGTEVVPRITSLTWMWRHKGEHSMTRKGG